MDNSLIEAPFFPVWARELKDNKVFIYNGASMAPLFKPGDLLCVRPFVFGEIQPGDIVVVNSGIKVNKNEYVVHRVISFSPDSLITRGDNNLKVDELFTTQENLIGKVTSYERKNRPYKIRGGQSGLWFARIIYIRNKIWRFTKRLGWRAYGQIRRSGWVARVWRPTITQIYLITDEGKMVKYRYGNHTVAHWWPQQARFKAVKPFDLVIRDPTKPDFILTRHTIKKRTLGE
jgi:signal peptidase I